MTGQLDRQPTPVPAFIWSVADLLRSDFPSRIVVLPTVGSRPSDDSGDDTVRGLGSQECEKALGSSM